MLEGQLITVSGKCCWERDWDSGMASTRGAYGIWWLCSIIPLRFLLLLSCFSPYHYRRSLAWLFICPVSMAKMPWATFSWHSFLFLYFEDQTFNGLYRDYAKVQGHNPWNLEQGALQGKVTFTLLTDFSIWKLIEQQSHIVLSMGQQQQLLKTYHSLSNAVLCIFWFFLF